MEMNSAQYGVGAYWSVYRPGFVANGTHSLFRRGIRPLSEMEQLIWNHYMITNALIHAQAVPYTPKSASVQVVSMSKRIEEVRRVLSISVSDLSEILGVTRPTVYSFMSGNEPVGDALSKYRIIGRLQLLCDKIEQSELPIPCNKILRRHNDKGESLKTLLQDETTGERVLDFFIEAEIEQHRENKRRLAASAKNRIGKKRLDPEAISTPFHLQ